MLDSALPTNYITGIMTIPRISVRVITVRTAMDGKGNTDLRKRRGVAARYGHRAPSFVHGGFVTLPNKQFSTNVPQRGRAKIRKWVPASFACYETSSLVYKALYSSNDLRKIHKTHTGRNL